MKRLSLLAAACAVALLATTAQAQNLLVDGNFDLAVSGSTDAGVGSAWTLVTNSPDGVNLGAQFQTGFANAQNTGAGGPQSPGTGTGVWFRSFEGNQGGSGEPLVDATLSQDVIAPLDGDYTLHFVAGREVNFTATSFDVAISSSGTGGAASIDLLIPAIPDGNLGGGVSPNAGGTPFAIELFGVTAGDVLSVTGSITGGEDFQMPGGQSAFLDSFVLLVPEPSSAMLLGLGFVGFLSRRRKA